MLVSPVMLGYCRFSWVGVGGDEVLFSACEKVG